ncbi:hypothetical protein SteCoe_37149 [Stentor coeruleus]|uniref:CBM20 domain-containing protein n=1 Tax=Stentor coeruleus TaxID=5963 RepID=A0A1R2ANV6_9CILI|nr:hypothetical protein SteCoe_37149 [Stentor coeruleus]
MEVKEYDSDDREIKEKSYPLTQELVKCISILDAIPEDESTSEDMIKQKTVKNEILSEKTSETRSEAQTEHSESPCTNESPGKLTDLPGYSKAFESEIKTHEDHKIEHTFIERPEMFASFISHDSKENPSIDLGTKYDDDFEGEDMTEKPSGKKIFSHFVKNPNAETKLEMGVLKVKEKAEVEKVLENTKLVEAKEELSEKNPQELKKEAIFTQIIKNTISEESHKPRDTKSYDFYTDKTSGVDPFYRKYEQERKSATSEDIKDQDKEIFEYEFSVHYETKFGESIVVVGSCEELGNWNPNKGLNLIWHIGHRWSQTLKISTIPFEYKYICKSSIMTTWEGGPNRIVSEQTNDAFYDSWQALN